MCDPSNKAIKAAMIPNSKICCAKLLTAKKGNNVLINGRYALFFSEDAEQLFNSWKRDYNCPRMVREAEFTCYDNFDKKNIKLVIEITSNLDFDATSSSKDLALLYVKNADAVETMSIVMSVV